MALERWPLRGDSSDPSKLSLGSPAPVHLPLTPTVFSTGDGGKAAIVTSEESGDAVIVDLDTETVRCRLGPHPAISEGTLRNDGKMAVTWGWHAHDVKIWNARNGALIQSMPLAPECRLLLC